MTSSSWRANLIALVVGALALLAGAPAVLSAVGVKNPLVLGGATALTAVVVAVGVIWPDRYKRLAQRRDEQAFKIEDGCLVLADGRLPRVRDITDPGLLGVHQATPVPIRVMGHHAAQISGDSVPVYVPRDIDGDLRERLAAGGFVLLVGDSTPARLALRSRR